MLSEDLLSQANSRISWQNSRKFSSLATKSVSQFTSTKMVSESNFFERIIPSTAVLDDFFSAFKTLFFLKFVIASSRFPPASSRAYLHSIIPKPVFSLKFFTSAALIVI